MKPAFLLLLSTCAIAQTTALQDSSDPTRGGISGIVQDEHGQPLADATVTAMPMGRPFMGVVPHIQSDAEGRFTIRTMAPGRTAVAASKEEAFYPGRLLGLWEGNGTAQVDVPSGGEVTGIVLKLSPGGRLEVKAENAVTGETIDAITVRLELYGAPTAGSGVVAPAINGSFRLWSSVCSCKPKASSPHGTVAMALWNRLCRSRCLRARRSPLSFPSSQSDSITGDLRRHLSGNGSLSARLPNAKSRSPFEN